MVLSSRETSSHESSVNGEQDGRVMVWVMQAGPWGFRFSFISPSTVRTGHRMKHSFLQTGAAILGWCGAG